MGLSSLSILFLSVGITILGMCCCGFVVYFSIKKWQKKKKLKRMQLFNTRKLNKVDNLGGDFDKDFEGLPNTED